MKTADQQIAALAARGVLQIPHHLTEMEQLRRQCEDNTTSTTANTSAGVHNWTRAEHEAWLATKNWDEDIKDNHRNHFEGTIEFDGTGGLSYG